MSKMISIFAFAAGAVVGGAAGWFYAREKYAGIADEEIQSVKMAYAMREQRLAEGATTPATAGKPLEKPDLIGYAKTLQKEGYTDYSSTIEARDSQKTGDIPHVISPEEFGEIEEYTKISLSYFADGVLADDNNEVVDDVEEIVGDALSHFGEYEDDAVFVRNDAKRCDYEILLDARDFEDVRKNLPPQLD